MRSALGLAVTVWGIAALAQTVHDASRGLEPAFQAIVQSIAERGWIGYSITGVKGDQEQVLFRVEGRQVREIRVPSHEWRGLDMRPQHVINGVQPADSVRMLDAYVRGNERRLAHAALAAIAMHKDAGADVALDRYLAPSEAEDLRRQTAFWLGAQRGPQGVERLKRVIRDDPSERVREHAVFALSISKDQAALPALLELVRSEKNPHLRKRAMFWLTQSKDPRATDFINSLF